MDNDRRSHRRLQGTWVGRATFQTGPRLFVSVLDLSNSGARLAIAGDCALPEGAPMALTAWRRTWWRLGAHKPVRAVGRIVRVEPIDGGDRQEVAVRFHTPLLSI